MRLRVAAPRLYAWFSCGHQAGRRFGIALRTSAGQQANGAFRPAPVAVPSAAMLPAPEAGRGGPTPSSHSEPAEHVGPARHTGHTAPPPYGHDHQHRPLLVPIPPQEGAAQGGTAQGGLAHDGLAHDGLAQDGVEPPGQPGRGAPVDDWLRPVGRSAGVFLGEAARRPAGQPGGHLMAVLRRWELAKLPPPLLRYILAVDAACVILGVFGASRLTFRFADLVTFLAFLAMASVAAPAAHSLGVPGRQDDRIRRSLLAQWTVPVALLLPPVYTVAVSLPLCCVARNYGQKGRSQTWFVYVFDAAVLGIAGFLASWVHVALVPTGVPYNLDSLASSTGRLGALFAATAVYLATSLVLLAGVRRFGSPHRARHPRVGSPGATSYTHAARHSHAARRGSAAHRPLGFPAFPGFFGFLGIPGVSALAGRRDRGWRAHPYRRRFRSALPGDSRAHGRARRDRPGSRGGPAGGGGGAGVMAGLARRVMIWGEPLTADAIGMCSAIIVAVSWAAHPLLVVAAAPPALLLQRSLLHPQLLHAARNDAKTGLANPAWWREVAEAEATRTRRAGRPLSVLLLDIDHFKSINDSYGHIVGDLVLATVAGALRAGTRPHQLVGRFGGEEFVVLLAEMDIDGAAHVAERLRRQVATVRCRLDGHTPLSVTVSVGAAAASGPDIDLTFLLEQADAALYRAKADGRNRIRLAGQTTPGCP